jgi:ABC-type multidrug transport system permease subunit
MLRQIAQLTSVIFKEFLRNPGIIFWSILFPILMAWGLGLAFTKQDQLIRSVAWVKDINDISVFLDRDVGDNGIVSFSAGSKGAGSTTYRLIPVSMEEAIQMVKKGKVTLILDESTPEITYHFDSKNPDAQLAFLHITSYLQNPSLESRSENIRPINAAGARYVDFLIPGLIAMNIMMSCMWGVSYSLIDKRIKKLLRRMVATPMKKSAFMIAQFTARIGLTAMEVSIIFLFSWLYFDITVQGGFLPFFILFIGGNIAFTGIAVLVSSRTSNTQIGNGLINLVIMPMMILSGIFFSYHNFPDWAISVIEKLPLTMLADSVRSVFNEGANTAEILPAFGILSLIGISFFTVGIKIYRWY